MFKNQLGLQFFRWCKGVIDIHGYKTAGNAMYRLSKQVVVWSDSDLSDQSVYSQLYLLIFGKSVCCLGILSYSSYPKMCSLSDAFDVCQAILHI